MLREEAVSFRPAPKPQPREKREPKPLRTRNAQRQASEFARAYHSEERVAWIQAQPCVVDGCAKPSENVHTQTGGTSRKADYQTIVPMCRTHHRELHQKGVETFEGDHLLDLKALALDYERTWRRFAAHALPDQPPTPSGA